MNREVEGEVYVDNLENPQTFLAKHPYGMSLLWGNEQNDNFNNWLKSYLLNNRLSRTTAEWLQVSSADWENKLAEMLLEQLLDTDDLVDKQRVIKQTRVNFQFDKERYLHLKTHFQKTEPYEISLMNEADFENWNGSVVPKYFWNNAHDFLKKGIGFCVKENEMLVSAAFSSFVEAEKLEIGIETLASYQGKNLAQMACATLIDYCIINRFEPIWSCRLANHASYKLALKLGFEPTFRLPYYRLSY